MSFTCQCVATTLRAPRAMAHTARESTGMPSGSLPNTEVSQAENTTKSFEEVEGNLPSSSANDNVLLPPRSRYDCLPSGSRTKCVAKWRMPASPTQASTNDAAVKASFRNTLPLRKPLSVADICTIASSSSLTPGSDGSDRFRMKALVEAPKPTMRRSGAIFAAMGGVSASIGFVRSVEDMVCATN